ncbi:hypothetical protein J4E89_009426 [Alternaria sp. Ai002NY15]|nr:hypothetical protein J4E89_009426 [Alternaria sp. Ai002NY15]
MKMGIARKSGLLNEKELEITEKYTVEELLKQLKDGTLSSLEVTIAFSKRAAMAQQLLSCLTETYFPEAQERGRFLDSERASGRTVGPLHGLPISIKDAFQVAGSAATIGFVSFLDHAASKENSPLVDILLELGAVVYVKTNIPQTMMARSIRIPALCCGTYGFKPSTARIPDGGQISPVSAGNNFFNPSAGPLANDIQALGILCRSLLSVRPALYDTSALDVPWRDLEAPPSAPKLRLGLLAEDSAFPLHPPVKRALAQAVSALEAKGHEVVPIAPARAQVANALALAFAFFMLDDTPPTHVAASGEPVVPSVIQSMEVFHSFKCDFLDDCKGLEGIKKLAALNVKRDAIQDEWRKIWKEQKLDGVIGPAAQHTAVVHDTYGLPPYTLLLNVLDYPACVLPFGKASSALDAEPFVMGPGQVGPSYDPKLVDGAPTAIQIFTNKMRDEECLQVSAIVDECLKAV